MSLFPLTWCIAALPTAIMLNGFTRQIRGLREAHSIQAINGSSSDPARPRSHRQWNGTARGRALVFSKNNFGAA